MTRRLAPLGVGLAAPLAPAPAELTARRDRTRTPAAKAEAIRRRAVRAAKYGTRRTR